jgi:DNA-binding NtrC family response regulator
VQKPPNVEALLNLMDKALGHREARHALRAQESEIDRIRGQFLAADPRQVALLQEIRRAAPTDATVLITGESGTGKELVAALLHRQSRRAQGPFHPFNCAAVNPELLRSELFGHVHGAFTGAVDDRAGAIETARGGTLFLDEIGASSCELQHGLLRLLEQREYQRVGDDTIRAADVRLLAATSSDLEREMAARRFSEALFHRLNVVRIHIPPLRDRRGDILPLARYFLARICAQMGRPEVALSLAAAQALQEHPWPGNVRELRNLIERAIIACRDGEIGLGDLFAVTSPDTVGSYHEARGRSFQLFQRRYLATQLRAADGNISLAAERSGLLRQAFARMLKRVGLDPRDFGGHSNQDVAP